MLLPLEPALDFDQKQQPYFSFFEKAKKEGLPERVFSLSHLVIAHHHLRLDVRNNLKLQIACVFLRGVALLLLLFCAEVDGVSALPFLEPPRTHGFWRFRPLDWAYGGE